MELLLSHSAPDGIPGGRSNGILEHFFHKSLELVSFLEFPVIRGLSCHFLEHIFGLSFEQCFSFNASKILNLKLECILRDAEKNALYRVCDTVETATV